MAGVDLAWAVRSARARIARNVAAERQAIAYASYGLDRLGRPLTASTTLGRDYLEVMLAGRADGLEDALVDLDAYLALVPFDPTQEA